MRRHSLARTLIWLGPLALMASSPLWLGPVGRFLEPRGDTEAVLPVPGKKKRPPKSSPMQNFSLHAVTITLTSKGRPEWRINAYQAFTGEKKNEIELVEVRAVSLEEDRPLTRIESRRGSYQVAKRILTLEEDVRLFKPSLGQELKSELMRYYDARQRVVSPGEVEIISPALRLKAGSMDYNLKNDGYDFKGRVRITM